MSMLTTMALATMIGVALPQERPPVGQPERANDKLKDELSPEEFPVQLFLKDTAGSAKMDMNAMQGLPKIVFFATYGDNNQAFDASAGSIDFWQSYSFPSNFPVAVTKRARTDQVTKDMVWPYHIAGYPAFAPNRVVEAKLRVDFLYSPNVALWNNDTFSFWDDSKKATDPTSGGTLIFPGELQTLLQAKIPAPHKTTPHWVSLVFDITPNNTSGGAYAYAIDKFGNPIPGRYYGMWKFIPPATRGLLLTAAADGDLQGWWQDDNTVSYVELMVKAL